VVAVAASASCSRTWEAALVPSCKAPSALKRPLQENAHRKHQTG
jgi:hypothetical protein